MDDVDKVISGMRSTSTVLIWVDVKRSLAGGVKWWRSENGVVLTEGVGEPKMLRFEWFGWVEVRGSGKVLYGEKVESREVKEMERRMDRLGVGVGVGDEEGVSRGEGGGEKASREKVNGEKGHLEIANGEKAPQGHDANGKKKLEPAAAVKDNWDD